MNKSKDTIFALATAPAKSGVAVVRISGPRAPHAVVELTGLKDWQPKLARYAALRATDGRAIDRGLILCFRAPHSFTGEDTAELQVHGSLAIIRELLDRLAIIDGLRPAEPGEFTRRAVLNDKMDLLEAEGLADLIDAETPMQKAQAMGQMQGIASHYFRDLRQQIIQALALLEAYIDFPDEDIPSSVVNDIEKHIATLKSTIREVLEDNHQGERVREGIRVVIVGAPNVGKSSLLNLLARRDAAIVSHHAGTTRDVIEVHISIDGFPVILSDTAGLRETSDDIEEEGVRRALARAEAADIKLVMFDATQLAKPDTATATQVDEKSIIIANKCDLAPKARNSNLLLNNNILYMSVASGEGVDALFSALENKISYIFSNNLQPIITRSRHRALLTEALACLERFSIHAPLEIACEELRRSSEAIGRITGKILVDELLDVVFREFCIGK